MSTLLIADDKWRRCKPGTAKRCRFPSCRRGAVVEFNRGRLDRHASTRAAYWWSYCEHHVYGRVLLVDGIYYPREPFDDEV